MGTFKKYARKISAVLSVIMLLTVLQPTIFAGASSGSFGIVLSQSGNYTFANAQENYNTFSVSALNVTVTNTGSAPTGRLNITLSGGNADAFTRSPSSIFGINAGASMNFTVRPRGGLAIGTYSATVTVSNDNVGSHSFNISFSVVKANYGISLSQSGEYVFPGERVQYRSAPQPLGITVTNTGDIATGRLNIDISGSGADAFTVPSGMMSVIVGGRNMFNVRVKTGLPKGEYKATITVGNQNVPPKSFNVSFTVADASFSMSLTANGMVDGKYTFPPAVEDYPAQKSLAIVLENTGNQATGALDVTISGANASAFAAGVPNLSSIPVGAKKTLNVRPVTGLPAGTYNATVTISNPNVGSKSVNVSFTVETVNYGYALAANGMVDGKYIFPSAVEDYPNQRDLTVNVINTGNQATGDFAVTLSGENAGAFQVSGAKILSIRANGKSSVRVRPKTGLAAGTYTATLTVSNQKLGSKTVNLSFTVTTVKYGFALSATGIVDGKYIFPSAVEDYTNQKALVVTLTNTGNQATGDFNVKLTGDNADAFQLSGTKIFSVPVGGKKTFQVRPKTGLKAGDYNATVTVFNDKMGTHTLDIAFKVTEVKYDITVSANAVTDGKYVFPSANENYPFQRALSVSVTNSGNQSTGTIEIALTGENADAFQASIPRIMSIRPDSRATFNVRPRAGLAAGTYKATVTLYNNNIGTRTFDVEFVVKK